MGLVNLLDMTASEMEYLSQYVKNDRMFICCHPAWEIFWQNEYEDLSPGDSVLNIFLDKLLDTMIKEMKSIDFNGKFTESMISKLDFDSFDYGMEIPQETLENTRNFFKMVSTYVTIYEHINQTQFLTQLRDDEELCVFILPNNYQKFLNYGPEPEFFIEYLNLVTADKPNFVALESNSYNNGKISTLFGRKGKKLKKLNQFIDISGVEDVAYFGGHVCRCLGTGEDSLVHLRGNFEIGILFDYCTTQPEDLPSVFLNHNKKFSGKKLSNELNVSDFYLLHDYLDQIISSRNEFIGFAQKAYNQDMAGRIVALNQLSNVNQILTPLRRLYSYDHKDNFIAVSLVG